MTAKSWKRLQCAILIFFLQLWVCRVDFFFVIHMHYRHHRRHDDATEALIWNDSTIIRLQVQTVSISYLRCLIEHVRCYILDRDIELVYYTIRKSSDVLTRDPMQLGAQVIQFQDLLCYITAINCESPRMCYHAKCASPADCKISKERQQEKKILATTETFSFYPNNFSSAHSPWKMSSSHFIFFCIFYPENIKHMRHIAAGKLFCLPVASALSVTNE